jgi:hypothetical protein
MESPYKTGTNKTEEEEDKDKRKRRKAQNPFYLIQHADSSNALSLLHIHTQKIERERELYLRREWKLTWRSHLRRHSPASSLSSPASFPK